jgi:hypothetical protein
MKKLFVTLAVVLAGISVSFAEVDPRAMPIIQDIQQGRNNNNAIDDLYVKDDATIGGDIAISGDLTADGITLSGDLLVDDLTVGDDLTVTGDVSVVRTLTVSGGTALDSTVSVKGAVSISNTLTVAGTGGKITLSGRLKYTPIDLSVVDGEALTNAYVVSRYPSGYALPTVTNTLAAPSASDPGTVWYIINASTSVVTLSEGSTAALGGATRELGQYDSLLLMAADASKWVEVSFSDN